MDNTKSLIEWAKDNTTVSRGLKYAVLSFSFMLWITGALFAAIGGWTISQLWGYNELSYFAYTPGALLAALGCYIFIISSFGVLGALRENLCFLRTYKTMLIVVIIFQLIVGLVSFAFWPEVKKIIDSNIRHAIENYRSNRTLRSMIDLLQRELECCGSLTVDDWNSNRYFVCRKRGSIRSCGVPWSCCLRKYERNRQCGWRIRKNRERRKLENYIHTVGCLDKGFEYMKDNMYMIAGVAIGCTLFLLIFIYMIHRLMKQIRQQIVVFNDAKEKFEFITNIPREDEDAPFVDAY